MYEILDPNLNAPHTGPDPRRICLPLDIMSAIISHLKSPSDLSRIARSSRINHFLALPLLYHTVTLRRPLRRPHEGSKRMALAALLKPGIAACVNVLEVVGNDDNPGEGQEWWDSGQWSDEETVWAVAVAGVLAGMVRLNVFLWNADGYVHPLLHSALSRHPSLKTFKISYPPLTPPVSTSASKALTLTPQLSRPPITAIPPFRSLHSLSLINLPSQSSITDDYIPSILFSNLSALSLSFRAPTPLARMLFLQRLLQLSRNSSPPYPTKLRLRSLSLRNVIFDFPMVGSVEDYIDMSRLETLSLISCEVLDPLSWLEILGTTTPPPPPPAYSPSSITTPSTPGIPTPSSTITRVQTFALKSLRINSTAPHFASFLASFDGLQELYILDPPSSTPHETLNAPSFLDAIATHHGPTLKRLRLCSRWSLERRDVSRLFRACALLEELAFSMEQSQWKILDVLLIFLAHLRCVHILDIAPMTIEQVIADMEGKRDHIEKMLAQDDMLAVEVFAFANFAHRVERTVVCVEGEKRRRGRIVHVSEVRELAGIWRAERVE